MWMRTGEKYSATQFVPSRGFYKSFALHELVCKRQHAKRQLKGSLCWQGTQFVGINLKKCLFLLLRRVHENGLHVTSRRPCWWSRTKVSPLGTKLCFHVNSSRKNSTVPTPNMTALSHGCKPKIAFNICTPVLVEDLELWNSSLVSYKT